MMRLIHVADLDMTYKANGYEKVFCFVSWPMLAIVGIFILLNDWLKERK